MMINTPEMIARQERSRSNDGIGIFTRAETPETINHSPKRRNPIFFVIFITAPFL
jgi:hypothetical protein